MLRIIVVVIQFLLLSYCQRVPSVNTIDSKESIQIIGGQPALNIDQPRFSTVGIYVPTAPDKVGLICTGLLTHGQRVITAAHCLTETAKKLNISHFELADFILIGFGLSVTTDMDKTDTEFSRIKKAHIHPEFNKSLESGFADIALIDLMDPTPFNAKPADIGDFDQFVQKPNIFEIFGLGRKTFLYTIPSQEMRKVTLPMKSENKILFTSSSTWTKGLCDGDSGAPVFIRGTRPNIAVGIATRAGQGCIGKITFVKLYPFIDWIQQDLSK